MFSRKVLEGVYRANIAKGKVPFAVLPIMAIGGAAAAADNRLTPQQEKILHEGSAPDKGQYTATAKTDYENHPPRVGREPTQKEIAEGRTDKFRVTPTLTGTSNTTSYNQYNPTVPGSSDSTSMSKSGYTGSTGYTGSSGYTGSDYSTGSQEKAHHTGMARIFDKDFWNRPLDESSRVLGTYVRQASIDLQRSPLRPEHQFSALAGENLEDRGPEDSLMKRVTNKVGEYLPHTQDTKRDYSYQRDTYEYPKGTTVSEKASEIKDKSKEKLGEMKEKAYETKDKTMEKMGEMKDKAADKAYQTKEQTKEKMEEMKDKASDKAYDLKEKTKEVASDLKEKVSEYTPSTHDMKEKLHETKEKAEQMADSLKNKVAEYIPSSLSNLTESVKSVVVGSESNESKVPGDAERMKTRMGEEAANLLQSHSPINAFKTHTSTIRLYADEPKRQLMTHKYTAHINEDVMQTLIMDSDRADARLIGVEYCISDKVYKQLPEDEKKFWYSHAFETKSGIEVAPRLPSSVETKLMSDLAPTWGKAVSLWHVDKNLLPVGFPKLMAPPANEQMINRSVWEQREKLFGPVADERQLRQPIQVVMPNRDEWDKKGAVFTPEYKKL